MVWCSIVYYGVVEFYGMVKYSIFIAQSGRVYCGMV